MCDVAPRLSRQRAIAVTALALLLSAPITTTPSPVFAQNGTGPASGQQTVDNHIADAARRFGIPRRWIRAVIEVESAGHPRAVSRAGAMGLMQIMPGTWGELRAEHRLGHDPFDPRDNILAGAAYLRKMYDRFGSPGFLAAYNAGPARYEDHLSTGRALPRETRNYLAVLAPRIGTGPGAERAVGRLRVTRDWRDAPLFVATAKETERSHEKAAPTASDTVLDGIFFPVSQRETP